MQHCRFCGRTGLHELIDLGHMPPSNSFLTKEQLELPETYYPLKLYVCDSCSLVQLDEYKKAVEIFGDEYVYYSSQSPSNVSHAKELVDMVMKRFNPACALEIASNDGYLLQHFPKSVKVLGIEPSSEIAKVARTKKIPTMTEFFGKDTKIGQFDFICGINVLAHVPDLNGFVGKLKDVLSPNGVCIFEFPHLMNLVDKCQFDTIYHEHYHYFSLATVCEIFERHLLSVFDVDEIPEHGGSLRIYAEHSPSCRHTDKLRELLLREEAKGMFNINYYLRLQNRIDTIKLDLVRFLIEARHDDKMVVAYGAPAKGNTLLNYCGIKQDLMEFVVDRSPHKQGKYLPGSHIPVYSEDAIKEWNPDYILILSWNLKAEIMEQLKYIREWGGKFVVAIPELEVL